MAFAPHELAAVGARMRAARQNTLICAEAMAEKLDCPLGTYLDYEDGALLPPLTHLAAFAAVTDTPLTALLYGARQSSGQVESIGEVLSRLLGSAPKP